MKLEYLAQGPRECPLARVYAFDAEEVARLRDSIISLGDGSSQSVAVHDLPGVESVGACRLTLCVGPWDQGTLLVAHPAALQCQLTRETWDNIAGLCDPFTTGSGGYQWLDQTGQIALLLSADGTW